MMKKLNDAIGKTTGKLVKSRGFGDTRIFIEWENIVGPELGRNSLPVKIRYPLHENDDTVLVVKAASGWNLQFTYLEPVILEKIATFFGYRLVSRLQIINAPVNPVKEIKITTLQHTKLSEEDEKHLAKLIEEIKNPEVKASMEKLGRLLLQKNLCKADEKN